MATRLLQASACIGALIIQLSCQESHKPSPTIHSLEPDRVEAGTSVPGVIRGENFFLEINVDLDSDDPPVLDYSFQVAIGPQSLAAGQVSFADPQTLEIIIPDSLPVGELDLTVTTPGRQQAILENALTVFEGCSVDSEGPVGSPLCSDGIDNDCDGLSDIQDNDCTGSHRRQITVTSGPAAVPPYYSVSIILDHQALVAAGKSRADGNDLRIVYHDQNLAHELDRVLDDESGFDHPTTTLWFSLPGDLPADSSQDNFYLYYGAQDAAPPPADKQAVYVFWEGFESGDLQNWTIQGDDVWTVADDQALSGTYSLKGHSSEEVHQIITAKDVEESDLLLRSFWRMSSMERMDLSQACRASASPPMSHYETNLESHQPDDNGWDISKLIDDQWTEIVDQPPNQNPQAEVWTKISIIMVGTQMQVHKDDTQIVPPTGWADVGTEIASGSIGFRIWRILEDQSWWIDNVMARKYVDPEPATSLGPEEQLP